MGARKISFIEAGTPGRFYSWKYIFSHLSRLDFHYTAVGIFAKRAVDKSLKAFTAYLDDSASTPVSCEEGTS